MESNIKHLTSNNKSQASKQKYLLSLAIFIVWVAVLSLMLSFVGYILIINKTIASEISGYYLCNPTFHINNTNQKNFNYLQVRGSK